MKPQPSFDASIPVLTEVFQDQPAGPTPLTPVDAETVESWAEPEMAALEQRLCERILQQLQGRVDVALEQRLRDGMEEALQHAMAGLTSEIRRSLQQTIEKIVVRAVAQELTHLRALKK